MCVPVLQDKSGVVMINATKETCHLLIRILTVVSHFDPCNGYQFQKRFDNLGCIRLCVNIFMGVHTIERLIMITRRESNWPVAYLFARYDVISRRSF